jgi:hypothetical protein
MIKQLIFSLLLCTTIAASQDAYGISSAYVDTRTKQMIYDLSMYQPVKVDSVLLFEWSSYSYYMDKEIMSKQWFNYWITSRFAVGSEIELWYAWNPSYVGSSWRTKTLYVTPRLGIQIRWW